MSDMGHNSVVGDELRQLIEQWEQLDAEKRDVADQQKEVMAEAKGRGYNTKVMRRLIAERKRRADEVAEEEAVLEVYREAIRMPKPGVDAPDNNG